MEKHTPSGRLIIGILHNSRLCSQSDLDKINTGKFCKERNSEPDKLRGMGDIFVKLSLVGKGDIKIGLKNIYGKSLKPCQKFKEITI